MPFFFAVWTQKGGGICSKHCYKLACCEHNVHFYYHLSISQTVTKMMRRCLQFCNKKGQEFSAFWSMSEAAGRLLKLRRWGKRVTKFQNLYFPFGSFTANFHLVNNTLSYDECDTWEFMRELSTLFFATKRVHVYCCLIWC